MCTSCYKKTVDEPMLIGTSIENPKLYPSQMFKQLIKKKIDGGIWSLLN